ncbi:MAG: hypothetical protein PVJ57_05490 [Phycisphaerae bacterium]
MSLNRPMHEIAERLRVFAAGLERDVGSLHSGEQESTSLDDLSQQADTLRAWGARVGEVLDEAFGRGVLHWEHYERLKTEEIRWARSADDWHYRLFLATVSHIAASESRTEGVAIPGFLCTHCPGWNFCEEWEQGDNAGAYCAAIRQVAKLVEHEQ